MFKTKFFKEKNMADLEQAVNKFIQDKAVIDISYTITDCGYSYLYSCCILYKESDDTKLGDLS